jgi:hypothetical protein
MRIRGARFAFLLGASGDQVTIVGNCNKNGTPTMRFEKVIFGNGQELEAYPRNF